MVPASGIVNCFDWPAGIVVVGPTSVRVPSVVVPLLTVSVIVPAVPPGGLIGSKVKPLVRFTTIWLPVNSVAELSDVPAVRLMVVVAGGALNAGFGAVALGQVGH